MQFPTWRRRTRLRAAGDWTRCGLLIVTLLIPGFRPPRGAHAQQPSGDDQAAFSLAYIPRDAVAVIAARPSALLSRPLLAPLREALTEQTQGTSFRLGVSLDALTEAYLIVMATNRGFAFATVVRTTTPEDAKKYIATLGRDAEAVNYSETRYFRVGRTWYFQPDARTVIMSADEPVLVRCIAAGPKGASSTNWAAKWSAVAHRDAVAIANTSLLRAYPELPITNGLLSEMAMGRSSRLNAQTTMQLAPLWQRSENIVVHLQASNDLEVRLVAESATDGEAELVQSAMLSSMSLARALITQGRHAIATQRDESMTMMMAQLDLIDEILEKSKIVRQQDQVGLIARADKRVARKLVAAATPTVLSAQRVSYRSRSMNNLKQIALAFHNYHDTFKRFPAAVQIGPKNIPHSWRVSILPFLDGSALYEHYRQDEPWDSPHNKQLIARMPDVYRSPADAADSTNTSYFALQGPGTVFERKMSTGFRDITDGTSNTLLVVEAKMSVPWTKPQEIDFDPQSPLPQIGGWYPNGFCAAMCDGRSVFIPDDYDRMQLRHLITRNDNMPTQPPDARR